MQIWLFQAIPENYDLAKEVPLHIRTGKTEDWHVRFYRNKMQKGDIVLLWQAGVKAGIYAIGKLNDSPYKRPIKGSKQETEWCVDVKYTKMLKRPIFKAALESHPVLKELKVLSLAFQAQTFK